MGLVIHINSWPGVGKLTIARSLASQLDAVLVDNHTLLNPSEALFDRLDPLYWSLKEKTRALVLDYASRLPPNKTVIFTDALSDDPAGHGLFKELWDFADKREATFVAVILECDPEENVRRLVSKERAQLHKLTRPEILAEQRAAHRLLKAQDVPSISLDVTAISAEVAALAILAELQAMHL